MAIARGAGTEIIRSIHLEGLGNSSKGLIFGAQHHIYTVLSIIVHATGLNADRDYVLCKLEGYDTLGGTTAQPIHIFHQDMSVNETYVFNDKFSFNGHEPTDFTSGLDSIVKQDAIADQGSSVAQKLYIVGEHGSDDFDVLCTFIDQNNA